MEEKGEFDKDQEEEFDIDQEEENTDYDEFAYTSDDSDTKPISMKDLPNHNSEETVSDGISMDALSNIHLEKMMSNGSLPNFARRQ